jgi:hypothetical protein
VKTRREGMEAADDFFGLFVGGSGYVDQHLTWELVARPTESRLFVVCQCWNIATQKCADTQETMSPNLPFGTKIGDISPCRRHVADITSQADGCTGQGNG